MTYELIDMNCEKVHIKTKVNKNIKPQRRYKYVIGDAPIFVY